MRKLVWLVSLLALGLVVGTASAQNAAFTNYCVLGAKQANVSGLQSLNFLQGVIPKCSVTVYLTGTTNKATIYSTVGGGTLANPFLANATSGQWLFFAAIGQAYDVVMSGGIFPNTYPSPVTLTGLQSGGSGSSGTPSAPNFSFQINNNAAFGAGPLLTDSTFQQLFYTGGNVPSNGALQYINQSSTCNPTALPSLFPGLQQGQDICSLLFYNPSYPGWNLGNTGGGAAGVMNNAAIQINTRIVSEGIKSGILMFHQCNSIGDCAGLDIVEDARGGCGIDASCEGYGGTRLTLREGAETTGTAGTTGNNLNTVVLNPATNSDGVGQGIYIPGYDPLTTTVTSASVGSDSTYGIMNTTSTTLPVSAVCSTVAVAPTVIGVLPEGTYVAASLTVNTTVDLTASVGQLATFVLPIISTYRLVSVGTYNSGAHTQVINLMINKNIVVGSHYCVGGLAGRGIEQTFYTTNGQVYLINAIGSPTNATIWFSSQTTQGPALPISTSTGTINIFHMATIVGISGNTFNLSDNDIHWVSGNPWVSTNTINQIRYDELHLGLWNDPYTVDQGHTWLKQGLSTQASQFVFAKNQSLNSNFLGHGGTYPAPLFAVISGAVGAGEFWVNSPDSCYFSGNPCASAAISMGPIAAGNTNTNWIVASARFDGDASQFLITPSDNSWHLNTPGQGTGDPNGPGYLATTYQFLAGAALTAPTHTIEASGSSGVSTVGADTSAAILIENRSSTGSSHEDLFFGIDDSINTRAIVGGLSMVNVSNAHNATSADLAIFLNNAGTPTNWFQFTHDGIFKNTGNTFSVAASGVVVAPTFNPSATQTVVNCATGTVTFSEPIAGASLKEVEIYANNCTGPVTYTFPTAFTNTPQVLSQALAAIATSVSTTAVTITGSTSTGFLKLDGY